MATVALGLINPLKYLSIMLSLPQVAQCFAIMIGNSVHYFYKWYLNFKYGKKKKKKGKKEKRRNMAPRYSMFVSCSHFKSIILDSNGYKFYVANSREPTTKYYSSRSHQL